MVESLRPPTVIQGGMGIGVSSSELARTVALAGEKLSEPVLGVVSGAGLSALMVERLQRGDGKTIQALRAFNPEIANRIVEKYPKKQPDEIHKLAPKPEVLVTGNEEMKAYMNELAIAAAFVEVWLAKQGHNQPIGINLLEKIQLTHLPILLGAMMARVDYVLAGAGIPTQIPKVLENFANGQSASYRLNVEGLQGEPVPITLDPKPFLSGKNKLTKPKFFPIISNEALARKYVREGWIDGFIVEGPLSGGHNPPARDKQFTDKNEPIYGDRDKPDLNIIKTFKPFYLAAAYAGDLKGAQVLGAVGIQSGTPFALCNESGMRKDLAEKVKEKIASGTLVVRADPFVSPSGYPFMVAQLESTLSEEEIYNQRPRSCKYGFLVQAFQKPDGSIGFRCPAESVDSFVRKGGDIKNTKGKVCLCEALIATAGLNNELPIVTLGKVFDPVKKLMEGKKDGKYSAEDVLQYIFSRK